MPGVASFNPGPSVTTDVGVVDLALVQNFLAVDGQVTIATRNPDKISAINLIGGPPAVDTPPPLPPAGSPSYDIAVNGSNIGNPRFSIDRINSIGASQPVNVLSLRPFALGSTDNTLTMKGAVFPSYVAFFRRMTDVAAGTLIYNAQYPLIFAAAIGASNTLNIQLAVLPATGSTFFILQDTNSAGAQTQTINFKNADGSITYGAITSNGLTKTEVTCYVFNNTVALSYLAIPINATGAGNIVIPPAAVSQMNKTLDKIQKGTITSFVP